MKTVIMSGGRGTRIQSVASDIPKPMIPIAGKPVLEREIECLRDQGFTELILTVSHMKEIIMDYFGDGSRFGVKIKYFIENTPLGNAGALFRMKEELTEDFLLLNADSVFDIDFNRLVNFHKEKKALATLFTHPNSHPYDSGLVITGEGKAVEAWLTKEDTRPEFYENRVNAGLHVISPEVMKKAFERRYGEGSYDTCAEVCDKEDSGAEPIRKWDLDRDLLKPLAGTGTMFAYDSPEYVKDMGTPERYEAVCRDFAAGIPGQKNLQKKQKAVFLDRDGVINYYVPFCHDINDFTVLPWAKETIRKINEAGYLAIVVTNQPVIARGEMTFEDLALTHKKMATELGAEGAYLDGIYVCPHHPHKGFAGEVPELKFDCDCRKPKPGLLLRAAEDFNIDLSESVMIGDSDRDVEAGAAAGCRRNVLIKTNEAWSMDDLFPKEKKMKFLVTGVCGQLGHDLMDELKKRGLEAVGTDICDAEVYVNQQNGDEKAAEEYLKLDITDQAAVTEAIKSVKPDAVLHCAAWTAVDAAEDEENKPKVYAVNVTGTKNIAEACKEADIPMTYISTDYVFDGKGETPWQPDCRDYAPQNYYGETKLQGELAVSGILEKYFIVRIAWVFGQNGKNFIRTMLRLAENHDHLRVVSDQIGTPTYTYDLARLLVDINLTDKYGYYHATNEGGYISWYDFTCEIFRQAEELKVPAQSGEGPVPAYGAVIVDPVTTAEYGASKAVRPFNSRLDKSKLIDSGFTPLPDWEDALHRFLVNLK